MPLYWVIVDYVNNPAGWSIYQIVQVIECTLEDVQYNRLPPAYTPEFPRRQALMFVREPDNPFKEHAEVQR